ncbi:MAG: N-acetyltransferase [Hyphomicrobiaceae bacterium]
MSPVVTTRPVAPADLAAISALHGRVFGPGRFARSAYRVREGTPDVSPFCRLAEIGATLVAAIRMTGIGFSGSVEMPPALLLGPLAVETSFAGQGHGKRLIAETMAAAETGGISVIVLVGNMSYYGRFGFLPVPPGQIVMPGPADPARILAAELRPGALEAAQGEVRATRSAPIRISP